MKYKLGIFFVIIFAITSVIFFTLHPDKQFEILIEKSAPYVGVDFPSDLGFDGKGIKIAVIDTGVDSTHPDLNGQSNGERIIHGVNFVDENQPPTDTNGHGTQVAGIIAANGEVKGIAPGAKIYSYKVSEDGEGVSSDLIVKAIEQAIADDVNIINISLGVNKTNSKIDVAVDKAIENGIFVVTAAGNDGPGLGTIGSPGINPNSITVGATYNNITSSVVVTLEVQEKQYQILPMIGTPKMDGPITAEIAFGGYGKKSNLVDGSYSNKIMLVERGSDVEGELLYFSIKESNAADAGAKALLVYNNEEEMFFGELIHNFTRQGYEPRIPTMSLSQQDGLVLKELSYNNTEATLNMFYNPDYVTHFSSRGPVSPFYIKPDLVAPGAFINTTLNNGGYNFTSGTSYAAPHVSGAAALLLQKNPDITPNELKSLLVTTTESVTDAYNNKFGFESAGSGRLDVKKAFEADLIILPSYVVFSLSPENPSQTDILHLKTLNGNLENLTVEFDAPEFVSFEYSIKENSFNIISTLDEEIFGDYESWIILKHNDISYKVPMLIHITQGSINTIEQDGKLNFEINHPDEWTYAKISVINKDNGKIDTTSATPYKDAFISVYEDGEYWVEANISINGKTSDAFDIVFVSDASGNGTPNIFSELNIPEKPIIIVLVIFGIVAIVGLKIRK